MRKNDTREHGEDGIGNGSERERNASHIIHIIHIIRSDVGVHTPPPPSFRLPSQFVAFCLTS